MDCIFEDYIKFVDNFLSNYFKILLGNKYEKRLVHPFIDKYIRVRYYNEYVVKEKKFVARLNKELNNVAREMIKENEDKIDKIKNIFALFSYVLFIERSENLINVNALLKTLYSDKNITLEYNEVAKQEINDLIRDYIKKRNEFFKLFESNEFNLIYNIYENDVLMVDLTQECTISKLYSEYAVEKAYNSELVYENRIYLEILMLSSKILEDIFHLDYSGNYIVDFPSSLFDKPKKIIKYLKALDNDYLKSKINLKIMYKDYKAHKKDVHTLINNGYSVCLELDETYDIDFSNLLLFSYVFVSKKYKYYDIIINSKEDVKTQVISL